MVTTQLDFFHLRTTAGLARQVRRVAGRMKRKNFEGHLVQGEQKLKDAIEEGDITKVKHAFEHLLLLIEKKEHYIYIIEKDELILFNEEEKIAQREVTLENQLKPFINQLAGSKPDLFKKFQEHIDKPLHEVTANIHKRTDQIRRLLAFLKADNVAGVTRRDFINKFRAEKGLERVIRREAWYEKRYVKGEKAGIEKLFADLTKINMLIKQGKTDEAVKEFEKIFKVEDKVFKEMKAEADYIYDIITKDTYLYVQLLDFMMHKLAEEIKVLVDMKFPGPELELFNKHEKELFDRIYDHIKSIYGLGRYQEIHAR